MSKLKWNLEELVVVDGGEPETAGQCTGDVVDKGFPPTSVIIMGSI